MGAVVEQRRQAGCRSPGELIAQDDDGDAGRSEVLLRVRVDHRVAFDVDRRSQQIGRHVADERHIG